MTRVEAEVFLLFYDSECAYISQSPHPCTHAYTYTTATLTFRFFSSFLLSLTLDGWNVEFGVYVGRNGVPLPDRATVEWEGQADQVSFRFPYALLFCSAFVEVRHLITGHLIQIIRAGAGGGVGGSQTLRCLWDGRGGARSFDHDSDLRGDGYHIGASVDGGGSSVELPTVLGAADLAFPATSDEWGAQPSSSAVTQQCVFTLFAPVPPPYSPLEEPVEPEDADSII